MSVGSWMVLGGSALMVPLLILGVEAVGIWLFGSRAGRHQGEADCAVILGAAIWGDQPSPVFRERIRHGLRLWQEGRVRFLLLTGGKVQGRRLAESAVARDFLLRQGVPAEALITEESSGTTWQNMKEAKQLMAAHGLLSALIVSDPLHLRRACMMASRAGITASPSATTSTRYVTLRRRLAFLRREVLSLLWFRVLGY